MSKTKASKATVLRSELDEAMLQVARQASEIGWGAEPTPDGEGWIVSNEDMTELRARLRLWTKVGGAWLEAVAAVAVEGLEKEKEGSG